MQLKTEPSHGPKPKNLIHFQNLVPGIPDSQFLNDYKAYIAADIDDSDTNSYRMGLLNKVPPILTFKDEDALKKFYEEEAKKCGFCCGAIVSANGELIDYYMYAPGNGKLYQGSPAEISAQLRNAFHEASESQTDTTVAFKAIQSFDKQVSERGNHALQPPMPMKLLKS